MTVPSAALNKMSIAVNGLSFFLLMPVAIVAEMIFSFKSIFHFLLLFRFFACKHGGACLSRNMNATIKFALNIPMADPKPELFAQNLSCALSKLFDYDADILLRDANGSGDFRLCVMFEVHRDNLAVTT